MALACGLFALAAAPVVARADEGPAASSALRRPEPRARVHVVAPHPAFLHRRAAGSAELVVACEAPCDVELPLGDTYVISGNGFKTTPELVLTPGPDGLVELTVSGPNMVGMVGGGVIGGVGVLFAYYGLMFGVVEDMTSDGYGDGASVAGLGLAVGAGLFALGALILVPSMGTDVRGNFRAKNNPPAPVERTPSWRSASSALGGVTPATFPLVYEVKF